MEKLFYHPKGVVKDGGVFCSVCGERLDGNLFSPLPCSIPTAAKSILGDLCFEIRVYNLRADLLVYQETAEGRTYLLPKADKRTLSKIERLVEQSVIKAGGAITWSGKYPISVELETYIKEKIKSGKLSFAPES